MTRSVSEKYKAIKDLERGMTKIDVQQKYAVNRNTLNSWLKSKEKIVTSIEAGSFKGAANKRIKASEFPDVEEALIQWLRDARAYGSTMRTRRPSSTKLVPTDHLSSRTMTVEVSKSPNCVSLSCPVRTWMVPTVCLLSSSVTRRSPDASGTPLVYQWSTSGIRRLG